jgi:hypothetical protein
MRTLSNAMRSDSGCTRASSSTVHAASSTPRPPLITAISTLSTITPRAILARLAPSAVRTASSARRAPDRARTRCATFTSAISNTTEAASRPE